MNEISARTLKILYYIMENLVIDQDGVPQYDLKHTNDVEDPLPENAEFIFIENHPMPFLLNEQCTKVYGDKEHFTLEQAITRQGELSVIIQMMELMKKLTPEQIAELEKEYGDKI